jgi:hypothetical protein
MRKWVCNRTLRLILRTHVMRLVFRGIAMVATSVALLGGVIGCAESNDQALKDSTEGKSKADPKAATSYEQLKPKSPPTTPPPGISLPSPVSAPPKTAAPPPDMKKD